MDVHKKASFYVMLIPLILILTYMVIYMYMPIVFQYSLHQACNCAKSDWALSIKGSSTQS